RNAKHSQNFNACNCKKRHNAKAYHRRTQCDLSASMAVHTRCESEEERCQSRRINRNKRGYEGAESGIIKSHEVPSLRQLGRVMAIHRTRIIDRLFRCKALLAATAGPAVYVSIF